MLFDVVCWFVVTSLLEFLEEQACFLLFPAEKRSRSLQFPAEKRIPFLLPAILKHRKPLDNNFDNSSSKANPLAIHYDTTSNINKTTMFQNKPRSIDYEALRKLIYVPTGTKTQTNNNSSNLKNHLTKNDVLKNNGNSNVKTEQQQPQHKETDKQQNTTHHDAAPSQPTTPVVSRKEQRLKRRRQKRAGKSPPSTPSTPKTPVTPLSAESMTPQHKRPCLKNSPILQGTPPSSQQQQLQQQKREQKQKQQTQQGPEEEQQEEEVVVTVTAATAAVVHETKKKRKPRPPPPARRTPTNTEASPTPRNDPDVNRDVVITNSPIDLSTTPPPPSLDDRHQHEAEQSRCCYHDRDADVIGFISPNMKVLTSPNPFTPRSIRRNARKLEELTVQLFSNDDDEDNDGDHEHSDNEEDCTDDNCKSSDDHLHLENEEVSLKVVSVVPEAAQLIWRPKKKTETAND